MSIDPCLIGFGASTAAQAAIAVGASSTNLAAVVAAITFAALVAITIGGAAAQSASRGSTAKRPAPGLRLVHP